jgi:hypothetical protein
MIHDIHVTLLNHKYPSHSKAWKEHFLKTIEASESKNDCITGLNTFKDLCVYCRDTMASNSQSKSIDFHILRTIKFLWRNRAFKFCNEIEFDDGEEIVWIHGPNENLRPFFRGQMNCLYDYFDIVSFAVHLSREFNDSVKKHVLYQVQREVWRYTSLFDVVDEDASVTNPSGVKGTILSVAIEKYGYKNVCNYVKKMYSDMAPDLVQDRVTFLHRIARHYPQLVMGALPYFAEDWRRKDLGGNTVLVSALLSENFKFSTCGFLLVTASEEELIQQHVSTELPICLLLASSLINADISVIYYVTRKVIINHFISHY